MKNTALVTLIVTLFTIFFSCKGINNNKVIITIIGENTANIQAMMALEDEYEKKHPEIDLIFKPNTWDEAFNKSNQDFANGTGLYDIVMQYNFALSPFTRNNYVYTLDELLDLVPNSNTSFEKDIYQEAWKELGYYSDGTNNSLVKVGYPFAINTMLLMYNDELFNNLVHKQKFKDKYGEDLVIPTTWDYLVKVAEYFRQPDKNLYGICMEGDGSTGTWLYYEFANFLFGMGGKVMDKQYGWQGNGETPILINSSESIKALKLYRSLKPFNAGNFTNVEQFEQMKIMKEGNVAMAIVWSDVIFSSLRKNEKFDSRFGFAPIPGNKSFFAGGSFFINNNTKNPKAVIEYIIYLMQPETQAKLAKRGLASPLRSIYLREDMQSLPYIKALKVSLDRGTYMLEAGPDADIIAQKITTYVQRVWTDEMTVEAALNKMEEEIIAGRSIIFTTIE